MNNNPWKSGLSEHGSSCNVETHVGELVFREFDPWVESSEGRENKNNIYIWKTKIMLILIISAQRISTKALEPENLSGNPNSVSYWLCDLRYLLNFSEP